MINWLKSSLRKFFLTSSLLETFFLYRKFLKPKGWAYSRYLMSPVDGEKNPLPWLTYSSIYFLETKIKNKHFNVLEYGSGNSTIWFSRYAQSLVSIEHDKVWYSKLLDILKAKKNINYHLCSLDSGEYINKVLQYDNQFDIILLDGRDRVNCAKNCLKALKEEGVIIWDNSDRQKYSDGFLFLEGKGFRRIDFNGLGPIGHKEWMTTIFYRDKNCFDI
ncbi:MAG: FkbM family methyltransferase [Leeuwenhoekiella sp.]|nr:FkbM family methyltransferase [Leeuwenhoekiella sp.]